MTGDFEACSSGIGFGPLALLLYKNGVKLDLRTANDWLGDECNERLLCSGFGRLWVGRCKFFKRHECDHMFARLLLKEPVEDDCHVHMNLKPLLRYFHSHHENFQARHFTGYSKNNFMKDSQEPLATVIAPFL